MSGIRPSSTAPVDNYYSQPWWVREAIRTTEIVSSIDLTTLSDKDKTVLLDLAKAITEHIAPLAQR